MVIKTSYDESAAAINQSVLLRPGGFVNERRGGGPSRAHLASVIILKINECRLTPGSVCVQWDRTTIPTGLLLSTNTSI